MFRSKRDPAKLLGSAVARSTPPFGATSAFIANMSVRRQIWRNRFALFLFVLNLWFFTHNALGWWRESGRGTGSDCSTTAQARNDDAADCHFLLSTGFIIGGFFYILPDALNRLTVAPLVRSLSSLCNCTAFRIEMGGILFFSSVQATLVGFALDRLVNRKRVS